MARRVRTVGLRIHVSRSFRVNWRYFGESARIQCDSPSLTGHRCVVTSLTPHSEALDVARRYTRPVVTGRDGR